jgi:coenzyme F420-0:L-glutamate ligase
LKKITLIPIKTPLIKRGDSIAEVIYKSIIELDVSIEDGDVIVIAETPVAIAEGAFFNLKEIKPSETAKTLAIKYQMDPQFVEIIIQEADEVLGGVRGVLLTRKNATLIANAGVDLSNVPSGHAVVFPREPQKSVEGIREYLQSKLKKKIAVILGDSRVAPLRRGTIGVALAVTGMEPIEDCRGKKDLYGRELQITFRALADDLVSAAQLLLGEADEQTPAVLIKGAPIILTENPSNEMAISKNDCLYMNSLSKN